MTLLGDRRRGAADGHEPASAEDAEFWTTIVRRVEQGDTEAEAQLVRLFQPRIRFMALMRLHGSDGALDLTQDTLLATLEALRHGSLREPAKLPAFVLGIARNIINNHLRRTDRRIEVATDPPERAADLASPSGDADAERRAIVRECLSSLSPVDRRILRLTLVEGMSPREVAAVLGLKPELVRTRKSRAVRVLRDEIKRRDMKAAAGPHK